MKRTSLLLTAACALFCQAALAQTTPASAPDKSTPNMQSSSSTNTGTQTSSPTTTGMDNGSVSPPAQTQERMAGDASPTNADGSTRKGRKTKGSMPDGKGKMKTKM